MENNYADIEEPARSASLYHLFIGGAEGGYYDSSLALLRDTLIEWARLKDAEEGIESLPDGIENLMTRYLIDGLSKEHCDIIATEMRKLAPDSRSWSASMRNAEKQYYQ